MDTNEYFERELEIINEITDSFDYDSEEIYSEIFEDDAKNVKEPIEDFLKYYREKTEKMMIKTLIFLCIKVKNLQK